MRLNKTPRIYLAGPEVFRKDAIECGINMEKICAEYGLEGMYPLDNAVPSEMEEPAKWIYDANVHMITMADAVIANITPFRGPHADIGTGFEIGFARGIGIPTILWSNEPKLLQDRIPTIDERDAQGNLVEQFNLAENLMITPSKSVQVYHTFESAVRATRDLLNLLSCMRVIT